MKNDVISVQTDHMHYLTVYFNDRQQTTLAASGIPNKKHKTKTFLIW